eukprot:gene1554-32936_t
MAVIHLSLCTLLVAVSQAEPFIGNDLPGRIPGPAIAGALGPDRMEVVASSYGMTVAKLQATIDQDKDDIWLTKTGKLVVHLDFNGEVVVAKEWVNESQYAHYALPYDIDGNPGSFSEAELYNIIDIWQQEYNLYKCFSESEIGEIGAGRKLAGLLAACGPACGDTATDMPDPGLDVIERSGQRVIISADVEAEASCECVGEAFLGTFGNNSDTPSFVYSTRLDTYNIASQAAHLVGHSLGLSHDGNSSFPTFEGHGADYNSWGPIMGAPFGKYVRQWSKGEYRDSNNTEDDVAIISSKIPLRPNDHGSDTGSATLLTTTECGNGNVATEGIISTAGQSDYFRIETLGGYIVAQVRGHQNTLPSLYVQVQLQDVYGNLLITSPPSSPTQSPSFESYQPAGIYFVSVTGIGFGDGFDTGYTNYGSL